MLGGFYEALFLPLFLITNPHSLIPYFLDQSVAQYMLNPMN